ncbi:MULTISPECIES: lipoprotein [Amphritea]|nr:lipoprotein [Amphritea atlantica]
MKKAISIALSIAVLSGCSETNLRAPVGEEIIWSSHSEKLKWTAAL